MSDDVPTCSCPHLDHDDWDRAESDWDGIAFLKSSMTVALGVPIGYYRKRREAAERAEAIGATVPDGAMVLLGEGRVMRPMLLEVEDAPEKHRSIVRPGGIAYTQLVEAPPGKVKGIRDTFLADAKRKYGRSPDDFYLWYLTCRECSAERNFETLLVAHYRNP